MRLGSQARLNNIAIYNDSKLKKIYKILLHCSLEHACGVPLNFDHKRVLENFFNV